MGEFKPFLEALDEGLKVERFPLLIMETASRPMRFAGVCMKDGVHLFSRDEPHNITLYTVNETAKWRVC